MSPVGGRLLLTSAVYVIRHKPVLVLVAGPAKPSPKQRRSLPLPLLPSPLPEREDATHGLGGVTNSRGRGIRMLTSSS